MIKGQLLRVTVIAYLLTFITGVAVVLPFVIKENAALNLHSDLAFAGYVLSFFMVGMIITEFLNGYIVKYIKLKVELCIIMAVYLLCISAMYFVTSMTQLLPIMVVLGLCFGVVTTVPNYIIVHSFHGTHRSSRLNRIDLFFSIGSFSYPFLAGYMLKDNLSWVFIYASVLIVWIVILFLLITVKLPDLNDDEIGSNKINYSKWGLNVYMIGLGIFFYFCSYVGFTYWLQPYLQNSLHISIRYATLGISLFWFFYGVGCFISSFAVKIIPVHRYIITSAIVAFICFFFIYQSEGVIMMLIFTSVLGLACSTVYSSSISYGSLILKKPSPRVVGFYITASGVGT
ncbi:MAG: MFS family permease, partial [Francisellaceae bacterium]